MRRRARHEEKNKKTKQLYADRETRKLKKIDETK